MIRGFSRKIEKFNFIQTQKKIMIVNKILWGIKKTTQLSLNAFSIFCVCKNRAKKLYFQNKKKHTFLEIENHVVTCLLKNYIQFFFHVLHIAKKNIIRSYSFLMHKKGSNTRIKSVDSQFKLCDYDYMMCVLCMKMMQ